MAFALTVGARVLVQGRGPGMLDMDNGDGTWNVFFVDGTDEDISAGLIEDPVEAIRVAGGAKLVSDALEESKLPGWTRFVCFSDTHGLHDQIPLAHRVEGDILIHAGDFTNTGEVEQVLSFAQWLKEYPALHKIVIAGNHDITFQPSYYHRAWSRFHKDKHDCERARQALCSLECCTYLEDEFLEVMGYRVYGSPWQPKFCDWAFNVERGAACEEIWTKIPSEVDILITHGPPYGFGDECSTGKQVGCEQLREAIRARAVPVCVSGHVHDAYGCTVDGPTLCINASTCDHKYRPVNPPIVFDVPPVAELRRVAINMGARAETRSADSQD